MLQAILLIALYSPAYAVKSVFEVHFDYHGPAFAPYSNITLGTPPQSVACVLDIGFSDIVVADSSNYWGPYYLDRYNPTNASRGSFGELSRVRFDELPAYWADNSSTYEGNSSITEPFYWNQYVPASGSWDTEVLHSDNKSTDITLGILTNVNSTNCIVGLGPKNGEVAGLTYENNNVYPSYPTYMEDLIHSNVIDNAVYSIWFDKKNGCGAVVFGGTDEYKYTDALSSVPIVSYISNGNQVSNLPGAILSTRVMFHGLAVYNYPYGSSASSLANESDVALDFSNTPQLELALKMRTSVPVDISTLEVFSRLPFELVDQAAKILNLQFIEELGLYACSCKAQGVLAFNLSGVYLDMDLKDLLIPASSVNVSAWKTSDGSDLCLFTVLPDKTSAYILGNGILRNIYTMVDLRVYTVSFAPLNHSMVPNESAPKQYVHGNPGVTIKKAPGYYSTSLARNVDATFYASRAVANGNVSVVNGAASWGSSGLWSALALLL